MALLKVSDRELLEGTSWFCEMEQQLNSLSSDDRIQEQPMLSSKYVQGLTKLDPTFAQCYELFRNIMPVDVLSKA